MGGVVPLLIVPVLLLLVMAGALLSGPQVTRLPTPDRSVSPPPVVQETDLPTPRVPTMPPGVPGGVDGSPVLEAIVVVLAILILTAAAAAVAWLLYRHRLRLRFAARGLRVDEQPAEPDRATSEPAVAAAVEAGLGDLDDGDADPRRAVIACWLRLEAAATAAGVERRPDDAPADLVTRLLRSYDVDAGLLRGLADLYRRARYAPSVVDEEMRGQARETLSRLRAELAAGTRGRTPL